MFPRRKASNKNSKNCCSCVPNGQIWVGSFSLFFGKWDFLKNIPWLSAYSQHALSILSAYSQHTLNIFSTYSQHTLNILSTYSQRTLNVLSTGLGLGKIPKCENFGVKSSKRRQVICRFCATLPLGNILQSRFWSHVGPGM